MVKHLNANLHVMIALRNGVRYTKYSQRSSTQTGLFPQLALGRLAEGLVDFEMTARKPPATGLECSRSQPQENGLTSCHDHLNPDADDRLRWHDCCSLVHRPRVYHVVIEVRWRDGRSLQEPLRNANVSDRWTPDELHPTSDTKLQTTGDLLRGFRRARHLSQVALGIRAAVDNTAISRFENGRQLPHPADLRRLAAAMRLIADEQDVLIAALQRDLLARNAIPLGLHLTPDELIAVASEHVDRLRALRRLGLPRLAVTEAIRSVRWLRLLLRRTGSDGARKMLTTLLANALLEQCKSYTDYGLPADVLPEIDGLMAEQRLLARDAGDSKLELLADISLEAAFYLRRDYDNAHRVARHLMTNVSHLDDHWQREVVRANILNVGYLGDQEAKLPSVEELQAVVPDLGEMETGTFLLEGLARSQALLGRQEALTTIELAWSRLDRHRRLGTYSSIRAAQLARTELRSLQALGETTKSTYEQVAARGLTICREMQYTRYEEEIIVVLTAVLD
jgi:transcriptional regulator with XRE-family HTH domain